MSNIENLWLEFFFDILIFCLLIFIELRLIIFVVDLDLLERKIREHLAQEKDLGESVGGSGHLGYQSISKFKMQTPEIIKHKNMECYEVMVRYSIHTESEFSYATEDEEEVFDYHTSTNEQKYILDKNLNIIHSESIK